MKSSIIVFLTLASFILIRSSIFVVRESQQAIITQFGQIRGEPIVKAGLHFKKPFVQDVRFFEKRILSWDGDEEQIPTKDKKYIWVDTTARWKIVDAKKFAENLQNEDQAKNKLDSILDGITRDTISNHALVEAVRNSNKIIEAMEERKKLAKSQKDSAKPEDVIIQLEQEIVDDIEPVAVGREQLSQQIAQRARQELSRFGIELIDVQLRRISYEKSVEEKVYERMKSERNRIAEKLRSIGKGEEAKILGKLSKDLKEIESEAYKKAQSLRGRAEADAARLYANSIQTDPEFYETFKKLEAYKNAFPEKGEFILGTDSKFLDLFK